VIDASEFPLLRHLYEVVGLEQPLDMPWERFFERPKRTSHGRRASLHAELTAD